MRGAGGAIAVALALSTTAAVLLVERPTLRDTDRLDSEIQATGLEGPELRGPGLEGPDLPGLGVGVLGVERDGPARAAPVSAARQPQSFDVDAPYDGLYHFARIQWGASRGGFGGFGRRGGREALWEHDHPRAERNFLQIMSEMTFVGTQTEGSNVVTLSDPDLFKYPIAYIVEVNWWNPSEDEIEALGDYLLKGGFLIVDDFRGYDGIDNLAYQIDRALPGHSLIMIDETQEVFDSFFRIVPEDVIPPYGGGAPIWYGVFEDNDPTKRMMVVINHNNDIAEYWEYSDRGYYSIDLSNEAYKLGVNYVVYGMTH